MINLIPVKVWLTIGGAVALLASFFVVKSHYITLGYNQAVKEMQDSASEEYRKQAELTARATERDIARKLLNQKTYYESALERAKAQEIIKYKIKEKIKYVEVNTVCPDVGPDAFRVFNETIREANKTFGSTSSASPTTR